MRLLITSILIFLSIESNCQNEGIIRGRIIDSETKDPLIGANVGIKGSSKGTITDLEGNFKLISPLGKQVLIISYIGYNSKEFNVINIEGNLENYVGDINMDENSVSLKTLTISASVNKNTELSLMTAKKKSVVLMDAVSAQSFKKSGDGNAASAVKRVTGITVSEGKYVYVRGLGDRYTKTRLNSMDIPGLDPDRNTIQMDIFPTNIIDNIKIFKSFSADLPADFTGGVIDIETKSIPDEKILNFSSSFSYSENSNLKKDFLTYNGGKLDIFTIDDGTYKLPINEKLQITQVDRIINYENLVNWSNSFSKTLSTSRKQSFLDGSFNLSIGDRKNLRDKKIGYLSTISYSNKFDYFEKSQNNYWRKPINNNIFDLEPAKIISGELGVQNNTISMMSALGSKSNNSSYKINLLHLVNTERKAGLYFGENYFSNVNLFKKEVIEFSQRSISNIIVSGSHIINNNNDKINWKISPTYSMIRDKDLRETPYLLSIENNDTTYTIDVSNVGNPNRTWRYLDEFSISSELNYNFNHIIKNNRAKLNLGINYLHKLRNYNILNYSFTAYESNGQLDFTGDPNEIMNSLLSSDNNQLGFHVIGGEQLSNKYEGEISNLSTFISEEYNITKSFKTVLGIRSELYNQFYTGQNQSNTIYKRELVLSNFEIFPSLNLIYDVGESSKIRSSIFKTTARPSFKEKSLAQIYDGISTLTFNGNIDLEVTNIYNFDMRYESYFDKNQIFSFSIFHKRLYKPIELSSFQADPDNIQPINTDLAILTGIEIELKKNIIYNNINSLNISLNSSLIQSKAFIVGDELNSRIENLRNGENLDESNGKYYRNMQGQSPHVVNLSIFYKNSDYKLQTGLFYNVKGRTLSIVSMNSNPDIYTKEFHNLSFNFNKKVKNHLSLEFTIENILSSKKQMVTSSYNSEEKIYKSIDPQRRFNLKISYAF